MCSNLSCMPFWGALNKLNCSMPKTTPLYYRKFSFIIFHNCRTEHKHKFILYMHILNTWIIVIPSPGTSSSAGRHRRPDGSEHRSAEAQTDATSAKGVEATGGWVRYWRWYGWVRYEAQNGKRWADMFIFFRMGGSETYIEAWIHQNVIPGAGLALPKAVI